MRTIKEECEAVVEYFLDDILFYLTEYPSQRKEYTNNFKKAFNNLIDTAVKELEDENNT